MMRGGRAAAARKHGSHRNLHAIHPNGLPDSPSFRHQNSLRHQNSFGAGSEAGDNDLRQLSMWGQLKEGIWNNNPKFRESVAYIFFVCIFTWVTWNSQGTGEGFRFTNDLRNIYDGFNSVGNAGDWFSFMEEQFVPATFPDTYYNGDPIEDRFLGEVDQQFKLLGAVAVRQVRIKEGTCEVPEPLAKWALDCFGPFDSDTESRDQYGPSVIGSSGLSFVYKTAQELGCSLGCSTGARLQTYPGGGFSETIPSAALNTTAALATAKIRQLKDDLWIDKQTRAVFVEFTVYNLPTNLVGVVTLQFEISEEGGSSAFIDVLTIRIGHLYSALESSAAFAAEGLLLFMVLVYTMNSLLDWRRSGTKVYWSSSWAYFEWINYVLFYVAFGLRYGALLNAAGFVFPPDPNEFVYYAGAGSFAEQWKNVMGANAFLTWFKIFKLFSHIPFMGRLIRVLGAVVEDVTAFMICFGVVQMGFALAFMLTYGNHLEDYSSLGNTQWTLYRMLMGDFDFIALQTYNRFLGPVYFLLYTMLTMCMLLNMFVAIIMEGYDAVREEEEKVSVLQFIKQKVEDIAGIKLAEDEDGDGDEAKSGKAKSLDEEASKIMEPTEVQHFGVPQTHIVAGTDPKLKEDMELVLAALVDFRKEMKVLSRRVAHLTESDSRKPIPPEDDPRFIE